MHLAKERIDGPLGHGVHLVKSLQVRARNEMRPRSLCCFCALLGEERERRIRADAFHRKLHADVRGSAAGVVEDEVAGALEYGEVLSPRSRGLRPDT